MSRTHDLALALVLIRRGDPLPLDLVARLVDEGIDVQALEDKHSL